MGSNLANGSECRSGSLWRHRNVLRWLFCSFRLPSFLWCGQLCTYFHLPPCIYINLPSPNTKLTLILLSSPDGKYMRLRGDPVNATRSSPSPSPIKERQSKEWWQKLGREVSRSPIAFGGHPFHACMPGNKEDGERLRGGGGEIKWKQEKVPGSFDRYFRFNFIGNFLVGIAKRDLKCPVPSISKCQLDACCWLRPSTTLLSYSTPAALLLQSRGS